MGIGRCFGHLEDHFFLKNGDPDTTDEVGDEVEDRGGQDGESGEEKDEEETDDPEVAEDLVAVEGEGLPAEGLHEALDVVDGARGVGHVPEQDAGDEHRDVEREVEDDHHLEDTPRVDVTYHTGDATHAGLGCLRGHGVSVGRQATRWGSRECGGGGAFAIVDADTDFDLGVELIQPFEFD